MPLGQIKGAGGCIGPEQKQQLVRKVMDAPVSVEGERLRQVTGITAEGIEPGARGVGGRPITEDDLRRMAAPRK